VASPITYRQHGLPMIIQWNKRRSGRARQLDYKREHHINYFFFIIRIQELLAKAEDSRKTLGGFTSLYFQLGNLLSKPFSLISKLDDAAGRPIDGHPEMSKRGISNKSCHTFPQLLIYENWISLYNKATRRSRIMAAQGTKRTLIFRFSFLSITFTLLILLYKISFRAHNTIHGLARGRIFYQSYNKHQYVPTVSFH